MGRRGIVTCCLGDVLERHGLTKAQLQREANISPSQIHSISTGEVQPGAVTILDILDALYRLTGVRYPVERVWSQLRIDEVRRAA